MSSAREADSTADNSREARGDGQDQQPVVLIDFAPRVGLKEVSLSPQDLAARSAAALDSAMASIRDLSERITSTMKDLARRPDEVEVEFGLKLDATMGALITRAGLEAHLTVTLKWAVAAEAATRDGK
jgi:Trypsin-co-occurring domain 1